MVGCVSGIRRYGWRYRSGKSSDCCAPARIWSGRHGIFRKHDPEDFEPTQFQRACADLQIEPIPASTPQAKGRIASQVQTYTPGQSPPEKVQAARFIATRAPEQKPWGAAPNPALAVRQGLGAAQPLTKVYCPSPRQEVSIKFCPKITSKFL